MSGIPAGAGSLLGKRLGKYDILALLALGGTAEIYLARIGGAAGFEKYVVVKCLHDHLADDTEFVKMFLDEARLAAMLDHSNIVQTFELGEYENRYYMVMEFLAGLSLAMIVRRVAERVQGGRFPVPLILNVAAQACAGLHYTHERTASGKPLNMVHRDISPQNLVISFEGIVKVVDFGIARAELRETKTKAGTIKGKFAYMSPEQCVATNVDRRTDVFALGVIVWELLTSRRLFKRNSPYETYQAVLECNVPVPSSLNHEIDSTLDELVMRAVAKDKDARYPTAEAFGDALQKYLHSRAKGSGPAELAKFFDQHFAQEIDEHSERMRELISGRDFAVDTGVSWGGEDEKVNETVDLGAKIQTLDSADVQLRGSQASLDDMVEQLGPGREDEDGDVPAEKTRIEMNPLERVKELDEVAARRTTPQPVRQSVPQGSVSGVAPLPAPPTGPMKPVVGAGQSGRFPDLANLPTVVASDEPAPEYARTALQPAQTPPHELQTAPAPQLPHTPPQQQMPHTPQQQMPHTPQPGGPQYAPVRPSQLQPMQAPPMSQPQVPVMPPMMQGGYPVVHGGRPFSTDLAPSRPPSQQRIPYTPPHDAEQAAHMVSPVGDRYPYSGDWAAAAARPAKAIPPWLFAALFVGALGVALLVTIVIAKIVR